MENQSTDEDPTRYTRDDFVRDRDERFRVREQYGDLYEAVASVLYRLDPVRSTYGINSDEYEPETGAILPRLVGARSAADVLEVVHSEFVHWFGAEVAGPPVRYEPISVAIWELWSAAGPPEPLVQP